MYAKFDNTKNVENACIINMAMELSTGKMCLMYKTAKKLTKI